MRLLVTNDDGVHAPGIGALAKALAAAGHEVTVVAPLHDASGSGTATGSQPGGDAEALSVEEVELERELGVRAFGVAAMPALCVVIALAGVFGPPPDLVVSGVNRGRNIGRSVLHSGTVGAALTASTHGFSALAVSAQLRRGSVRFDTACEVALPLLEPLTKMPLGTVLNVNAPALGPDELLGVRRAVLGTAQLVTARRDAGGRISLSFGLDASGSATDSDEVLTMQGYATITAVVPPGADPSAEVLAAIDAHLGGGVA